MKGVTSTLKSLFELEGFILVGCEIEKQISVQCELSFLSRPPPSIITIARLKYSRRSSAVKELALCRALAAKRLPSVSSG